MIDNTIYDWKGRPVGFRCSHCEKIYQKMRNNICNSCRKTYTLSDS